eukprot:365251-Chlamydomonas_euryale.AAC.1
MMTLAAAAAAADDDDGAAGAGATSACESLCLQPAKCGQPSGVGQRLVWTNRWGGRAVRLDTSRGLPPRQVWKAEFGQLPGSCRPAACVWRATRTCARVARARIACAQQQA